MKQKIIDKLIEIDLFGKTSVSEEEFNKHSEIEDNFLYYTTKFDCGNGTVETEYWRIDTKDLTPEEIDLLLKIDQTKNIRTIKNVAIFFVILTVISLIISIISAVSTVNMF